MTLVCDNCKLIFKRKTNNCPFCGGRIYSTNESVDSIMQSGYSYPQDSSDTHSSASAQKDSFSIDDDDIIASLRSQYYNEHRSKQSTISDIKQTGTTATTSVDTPTYDSTPLSAVSNSYDDDFFAQYQTTSSNTDIPTINYNQPTVTTYAPNTYSSNDEYDAFERQQRRMRNNQRRAAFADFFRNLRLRTVLRVISAIAIIICAILIWVNRYAILESLTNFLISTVLPILIVAGIIAYIIRSIFKKE